MSFLMFLDTGDDLTSAMTGAYPCTSLQPIELSTHSSSFRSTPSATTRTRRLRGIASTPATMPADTR